MNLQDFSKKRKKGKATAVRPRYERIHLTKEELMEMAEEQKSEEYHLLMHGR